MNCANRSGNELREPFRQSLVTGFDRALDPDWITRQSRDSDIGAQHAIALRNEINIVDRSLHLLTPALVKAVVTDLIGAENAFVTATRSTFALAYYFQYIGRMAMPGMQLVPRHMGNAIEDMADMSERDIFFAMTFRPYSAETIQAMRFANSRGAKVILMTDSELVAPNIQVEHLIQVNTQSTHHFGCYAGGMAVLDCLLAHLVMQGGPEASSRIAAYEEMRQDSGAYWKPSRPRIKR